MPGPVVEPADVVAEPEDAEPEEAPLAELEDAPLAEPEDAPLEVAGMLKLVPLPALMPLAENTAVFVAVPEAESPLAPHNEASSPSNSVKSAAVHSAVRQVLASCWNCALVHTQVMLVKVTHPSCCAA